MFDPMKMEVLMEAKLQRDEEMRKRAPDTPSKNAPQPKRRSQPKKSEGLGSNATVNNAPDNVPDNAPRDEKETPSPQPTASLSSSFSIVDQKNKPVIGVRDLAGEVANLIANLADEPGRIVGVFGQWGRGKTFLITQIWEALDSYRPEKRKYKRVDFHAWKYQDTPAIWAYLYERIADSYLAEGRATFKQISINRKRIGSKPIWGLIGSFLFIIVWHFTEYKHGAINTILEKVGGFWGLYGILGFSGLIGLYKIYSRFIPRAREVLETFTKSVEFKSVLGFQAEIEKELRCLLECWIDDKKLADGERILLVVDDVDRCSEERMIQIIDSLRVMLEADGIYQRVVVLVAVDERVLERAIKWKYREIADDDNAVDYDSVTCKKLAKEYMDKLFISGIRLGNLSDENKRDILEAYTEDIVEKSKKENVGENAGGGDEDGNGIPEETIPKEATLLNWKRETYYNLLERERDTLLEVIEEAPNITPRQIRIFLYRYLLARNLLHQKLPTKDTSNLLANCYLLANMMAFSDFGSDGKKKLIDIIKDERSGPLDDTRVREVQGVIETVVAY